MLINSKDIARHNARQWRVDIGNREVKNESEWVRGSPLPFFSKNTIGFKEFTITLMVYGDNREDIQHNISDILSELLDPADMELDGYEHKFCGILDKYKVKEYSDHSRHRFQTLELQFSGYEYGDEVSVTASGAESVTIINPGNAVSPVILELTPTLGAASITVTGICRDSESGEDLPVTISNLTTGNVIVLDGITGLITENDVLKAADVDIWAMPTLLPGGNTINLGTSKINATVKVLPIYM